MEVSLAWVSKTSVGIAESTAVSKQKTTRDHPGTRAPRSSFTCPRPHPAQQGQPDLAPYPSLHNAHKIHPATQNKVKAEGPYWCLAFATTGSKQKKTAVRFWHKTAKAETTKPPKNFKSPSQDIPVEKKILKIHCSKVVLIQPTGTGQFPVNTSDATKAL